MKRTTQHIFFIIVFECMLVVSPPIVNAQEQIPSFLQEFPDSTAVQPDSLISEPLTLEEQPSDIDTVIYYEAEIIDNDLSSRQSYFIGNAGVKYKDIVLEAGKITLDWDRYLIIAESILDTTWVKTDSLSEDSTQQINRVGEPVLTEGGTQMTGRRMEYNYKTEKGRVIRGRSDVEGGKYVGTQIKRVKSNIYNVSNSTYTTCDLDSNPHFHFEARRMKMIPNDKVIAKPIVAKIGHIPVFILPFAVFPHQSGRHSGLLIPRYGESIQEGRFLRDLGYYWAPNNYFDAKGTVDFFEKSGFLFRANANYSVRYLLNGSISGSFTRKDYRSGDKVRRWDATFQHSQEITPTSRFSASGNFVSDKDFYKSYSTNLDTRLNRELRSNATYSKSWPKQKLSLSLNVSHTHDLQEDLQTYTLPQFSFRKGQSQIFKPKKKGRDTKWYNSLYFSYNSNLVNSGRQYYNTSQRDTTLYDLSGESYQESISDTTKELDITRKLSHNVNLSLTSPKKYFGWLLFNQSLRYKEDWFDETYRYSYDEASGGIEEETMAGFATRRTFSYSASANTKAYGVFPANIGDIESFRHVMTPSLSLSWSPDFSGSQWGYFQTVETPTGEVKKDRFGSGTPSMGGGSIGFGVRNLFQMKRGQGEKVKKIDLFNLDLNTSYNLRAENNNLQDLRTSWTANPTSSMSLSAGTTHSFYQFDQEIGRTSTKYNWQNGGWRSGRVLRLTNVRFNFRIRLSGKSEGTTSTGSRSFSSRRLPQSYEEQQYAESDEELSILEEDLVREEDRFEAERAISSLSIPWRMNLDFNYNLSKQNPVNPRKQFYVRISGAEVSLTSKWRIGYSAQFDIAEREIAHHRFTIYRDLHCWEANIDWVPSGAGKRIYVRVSIKAPMFKDIKIEKRGGQRSVLGY